MRNFGIRYGAVAGRYFAHAWQGLRRREIGLVLVVLAATLALVAWPNAYARADSKVQAKARVLAVDDSGLRYIGPVVQGEQSVEVKIESGRYKGLITSADNILMGKKDLDVVFKLGDFAFAVLDPATDGGMPEVSLIDHYRLDAMLGLGGLFVLLLVLYGGWTGLRTLVAFAFALAAVWKLYIPAFLGGGDPLLISLAVVTLLTVVIVYLVAGFCEAGNAAVIGTLGGTGLSAALALWSSGFFKINGAVRPFSEMLLYGGYDHLDLSRMFLAGTLLAASGAIIDLAIDVAVALEEVKRKRPGLGFLSLLSSGLLVGRKVFGTMTTTLLLAYTGGYTSLLMVFMAQGVPAANMFNISYVSAEVFHTLIGSLGLVLVAPLTALAAAFLYSRQKRNPTRM